MVPQTLFMFCQAAECPPFGAIVPCHFISDNISSALLLLKDGGGVEISCQQRVLSDLLVLGAELWLLASPTCCLNAGSENRSVIVRVFGSGAPYVWVCANFHGFSSPHIYTNEQESCMLPQSMCLIHPQITSMHTHAGQLNMADERSASVPCFGKCIRRKSNYHHWLNNQQCNPCKQWAAAKQTHMVCSEQDT